jgi:membrane associated rhomboid family serine protease
MFSVPPVTQALIIINVIVFFAGGLLGAAPTFLLALWPLGPNFMPWQLLTYAFVHSGLTHLLFNMFGLYMFGGDVERVWGARRFLSFYIVCALSAAALQLVVTAVTGAYYPTVGASGAVFGLLLAFALLFPRRMVMPIFPPIPMRAPVFVALYGILELVLGVTGTQAGVAHFAHLGGLAGGFIYMRFWNWRR